MSRNLPKFDLWHFSVCLLVFSELNLRFNGIRKFSRITVLVEAVITWKQNWSWKSSIISRHPWFYPHFRGLKRYHLKGVIYNKFRFRFVFLPGAIFSEKCSRACVKQDQQNSPYSFLTVFFYKRMNVSSLLSDKKKPRHSSTEALNATIPYSQC